MTPTNASRSIGIWIAAFIAVVFGLLTLKSGGSVIFIDGPDRAAAGHYFPFVVWFNFLAGFAYIVAGIGLLMLKPWSAQLAFLIMIATLIVFAILGVLILLGNAFETRTVGAMTLRSVLWAVISLFSYRKFTST